MNRGLFRSGSNVGSIRSQPGERKYGSLSSGSSCVSAFGVQHLEGDGAVVLDVLGQEDRGHPPATQLALEDVAGAQAFLELGAQVGHYRAGVGDVRGKFIRVWPMGAAAPCPQACGQTPARRRYGAHVWPCTCAGTVVLTSTGLPTASPDPQQ